MGGSVVTGQTVNGSEIPRAGFTGTQMRIDLKENDRGTDYSLGEMYISNLVGEEQTRTVGCRLGFSYCYELVYAVQLVG